MTNKEYILDCLAGGGDYGECETQIKEYFNFIEKADISIEQLRELINEMLADELIRINEKWMNEVGEKPYVMTDKGREVWNKNNKS